MDLYVYGATAQAKMTIDLAERLGKVVKGCIDKSLLLESVLDYSVELNHSSSSDNTYFLAIKNNGLRKRMFDERLSFTYISMIDPQAIVSKYAEIEAGSIVFGTAVINADVQIGRQVIIGSGAVIQSNTIIEDFVNIGANVSIGSNVLIGEGVDVEPGAVILDEATVAPYTVVPALSVFR